MKKINLILILVLSIVISIFATTLVYNIFIVYEAQEILMDIKVGDHIGLNLDTDALHFGISMSPGSAARDIIVSNDHNISLRVDIRPAGKIADWVLVKENNFVLKPGEKKNVEFEVNVPKDVEVGLYEGVLRIFFRRVY